MYFSLYTYIIPDKSSNGTPSSIRDPGTADNQRKLYQDMKNQRHTTTVPSEETLQVTTRFL